MSFFGFGQSADIDIELDGADSRKFVEVKQEDGRKDRYYLYFDGETVSGKVNVNLKKAGSRFEHQGIKIEFVGQIELYFDRGNHHEFTSLVKELARPGDLLQNTSYDFEFNQVEKPYESYSGANVRLRYFLKVTIVRRITDMIREMDLIVHTLSSYPDSNNSIKMEVGIEECLHIEFEYNKSKYHLKDVIVGKIYFLLVRIKIKHMEIAIMKKETTGSGPNTFNENETIAKYEIMDGAPVRGESIPIRVFLAGYDLTPSMRDINKKFSVRYYLNLVLVDEEERRYFKQQEITLWRKGERVRRPLQEQLIAQQQAMQHLHLTSDHIAAQAEKARQQAEKASGEANAPLGAEPASPHQSQSPMQEEKPLVSEQSKEVEAEKPALGTVAEKQEPALPKETERAAFDQSATIVEPESVISVEGALPSSITPPPVSNAVPPPASVTPPLVTSATPPPLPVTEESSLPIGDPSVPPPLPYESSPSEEVESNGIATSPLEDITEKKVIEDDSGPALNMNSDLPPFVGSCEPPSLPTPPNDALESPEDEEEFLEAATSPIADKKEPALAQ